MEPDVIEEFLGCGVTPEIEENPKDIRYYLYQSEKLKYELIADYEDKVLSVSADFEYPFGFRSLFEVAVEFDRISMETEPEFYGDQKILVCRKDYPSAQGRKTLMLMKWPSGELSVWPMCALLGSNEEKN